MEADISEDLAQLEPDLVALRRDIHQHPELGFQELRTASLITERMRVLGYDVRSAVGTTGVIADLAGEASGPILLIRADMDALPLHESATSDFKSRINGVMHACGHDAHVAAAVGAAALLADRRRWLHGGVRFAFQPAEELGLGAQAMISGGVLDGVDRVLAAHVFSPARFGTIVVRGGPFLAGCDVFELTVLGKAGHGGMPETSVDPIFAAAQLVTALQSIVARETKPGEPLVVSVAAIEGGVAANVVVDQVKLRGTIRWFNEHEHQRAVERLDAIAAGICSALRAQHRLEIVNSIPPTVNEIEAVDVVESAIREIGGAEAIDLGLITASEDFSYFLNAIPGCIFGVGAGGPGSAPHHHHAFEIDERAIGLTTELFVRVALRTLAEPS
ncbi:MAG: M20 metallopeptidase family protein [Aggregatilineales bacterium]